MCSDKTMCHHRNVYESADLRNPNRRDNRLTHWRCLDCGDFFPLIGDTDQWTPKIIECVNVGSVMVQIDPVESECLEIRFQNDPPEVVVLRHGMAYTEGGEAVYSELIDPECFGLGLDHD